MNIEKIINVCKEYLEEYFEFTIIYQETYTNMDDVSLCFLCQCKSPAKQSSCNHSDSRFIDLMHSEGIEFPLDYRLRIKCSQLKYIDIFAEVAFVFTRK